MKRWAITLVALVAVGCHKSETPSAAAGDAPDVRGHRLVQIPAGTWKVGTVGHPFNPPRTVTLAAFQISDAETTNAQFAVFVEATAYQTDAEKRGRAQIFRKDLPEWKWGEAEGANWKFPQGPDGPKAADFPEHPVTQISMADAEAYCAWVGGRLPTLAEWEVAARAGSAERYPWGAEMDVKAANTWTGLTHKADTLRDGYEFTAPVRSFSPNAWGLHDVIGNVFEYCSDLPPGMEQREDHPLASARGGSWWCSEHACNAYNLIDVGTMEKHGSLPNQGFRVVFAEQAGNR